MDNAIGSILLIVGLLGGVLFLLMQQQVIPVPDWLRKRFPSLFPDNSPARSPGPAPPGPAPPGPAPPGPAPPGPAPPGPAPPGPAPPGPAPPGPAPPGPAPPGGNAFHVALFPDLQGFSFSQVVLSSACHSATDTSQIKDMLNWIRNRHNRPYGRTTLDGFYQFVGLIGDFVDGNGGQQAGQDMWIPVNQVFNETLAAENGSWSVTLAGTTGNHDYHGPSAGAGHWDDKADAVQFLTTITNKHPSPPLKLEGTDFPLTSYKQFEAGGLQFIALFIPWGLPPAQKAVIDEFIAHRPQVLFIILVHFRDECKSFTIDKHKNCFTLWEGHVPLGCYVNGNYDVFKPELVPRSQGGHAYIFRADWQDQGPWDCALAGANLPQHPIFNVFSFEVAIDKATFTMFRAHVQAWNPNNPCYSNSTWAQAKARIAKGPEIDHTDQFQFVVADYI